MGNLSNAPYSARSEPENNCSWSSPAHTELLQNLGWIAAASLIAIPGVTASQGASVYLFLSFLW